MRAWLLAIVPVLAGIAATLKATSKARTIALLVLSQGLTALVVDHHLGLGQPRSPISMVRTAGVALLVAGTLLVRWR